MTMIGTAERYGEHYTVERFYANGERELVADYMTLDEAQAHCRDGETSSSTATSDEAIARTAERGPWFDGYREA
jgi:hypothetical protein